MLPIFKRVLLVVVALLVLALVAGWLALRTETVERALLGWLSTALESRFGLTVDADTVRLRPAAGSVDLATVTVADADGGVVAAAERVEAEIDLLPLLRGRLVVPGAVLERPRLDLARLPELPEDREAGSEPTGSAPVEIRSLLIRDGALHGLPALDPGGGWAWAGTVEGIEIEASLVRDRLRAVLTGATARVTRAGSEAQRIAIGGELAGPLEGPLELAEARLEGRDLGVDFSGTVGISAEQPLSVVFDGSFDAGRLIDGHQSAPISAAGEIDFRAGRGTLAVEAPAIPAELSEPWLEPELFSSLAVAGTTLRVEGQLRLGPGGLDHVAGSVTGIWTRGDEELLVAELTPEVSGSERSARIPFELGLTPGEPGRRKADGVLEVADWNDSRGIEIENGRLELRLPDLAESASTLERNWPRLSASFPAGVTGALDLAGSFSGRLDRPRVDLEGTWRAAPRSALHLALVGMPLQRQVRLTARAEDFPLGAVVESSGAIAGRVEVETSDSGWSGTFDLDASGLRAGGLEELEVSAAGELAGAILRFSHLEAGWQEHRIETTATVARTADGLGITAERLRVDGLDGALSADLPGALLAELPAISTLFGSQPWTTPASRERRVQLAWDFPEAELGRLLELEEARLEVATSGELWLDLDRPSSSTGSAVLSSLSWASGDRRVAAPEPVELRLADGRLAATGVRVVADGSQIEADLGLDLDREWRLRDRWSAAISTLDVAAAGRLDASWPGIGPLALEIALTGGLDALTGRVAVEGAEVGRSLEAPGRFRLEAPRLELLLDGRVLTLARLEGLVNGAPLLGNGYARLAGGRLEVERLDLAFAGIESFWSGSLPLARQERSGAASDELTVEWRITEADLGPALLPFELIKPGDSIRAGSSGSLRLDLSDPARVAGVAEISGLDWRSGGRRTASEGPIRVEARDARLTLEPLRLISEGHVFNLSGEAELADAWAPGEAIVDLIENLEVRGNGTLLTSLLNPFLGGAVAEGYLNVDLEGTGPPRALSGRASVSGSEARLTYARPYAARISDPELELVLEPGGLTRLDGRLWLNEGRVSLAGGASGGVLDLQAAITGARFRLDYGLLALVNGDLALLRSSTGAWALGGTIEIENGVLTRDIDLDIDLLLALLAPADLASTEANPLEAVALELDLTTVEGVRVKNNVADLLVRWEPVRIRGTLAVPVLDGRLEIDPGGRVSAFGQTVRIDSASLDYPGEADLPATLDLDVTSSFQDPSIASLEADDPFAGETREEEDESARLEAAAAGLGTFYGERIASRLTGGITGARISLQPLLIFGETDPGARLTVSQDFSPQVTLAASVDLRNAEARTYLLNLHGVDALPGLSGQVFTTDEENQGAALQQRLRLGPGGSRRPAGPKIRKIRYDLPEGISKRRLKRALGLRKGDRLAPGARFGAEVDIAEALRRRGVSDARVSIEEIGLDDGVELMISVRPGPRARFEFVGPKLSKTLRRSVSDLYRSDYYEATALEEMAAQAERALRSRGYLDPKVDVEVTLAEPSRPESDRQVTVSMVGGERIDLERVRFEPLPAEEAALLEARFSRPVRRMELAAGLADADRRVEQALRYFGYPEPRVVARRLADDGRELELELELGERPRLASIELVGVDAGEADRLSRLCGLEVGDPVRSDRIAAAALTVRDDLRSRGFAEVVVEPRVIPTGSDAELLADLRLEVEPGSSYFVGEVRFGGLASTRPSFAGKVADLMRDEEYSQEGVLEARRRLWATNLFDAVTSEVARAPGGAVRVDFALREKRRFEFAYGVRWDSEEKIGGLLEVVDRNALGRSWTLGVRAQWAENAQSLRTFAGLPRLFNPRSSLGLFAAIEEETEFGLITETIESTLQLGYRLSQSLDFRLYGRLTESRVREEVPDPRFPFDVRLTRPMIGTQVVYDRLRGEILSIEGLLVTSDLSYSDNAFGSDFDYARFFGRVNYLWRLSERSFRPLVWAQSVRIGLAEAFDQELIRQERFFAGGEFSVRGYATESLGPQERLGLIVRPMGGEALLVVNEELRWRFADRFTAVLFLDAGNVWIDRSDLGSDLLLSTGLGLRALTPLGVLRLDLAHALDRRPFDPEYKLYLGFGNTF